MAIFCNGTTDSTIKEKECLYIMFCKSDTFEPVITFLSLKDLPNQDADSIKSALSAAFNDISMRELASKVVFLASDGVSVISGVKSELAVKFHEVGVP